MLVVMEICYMKSFSQIQTTGVLSNVPVELLKSFGKLLFLVFRFLLPAVNVSKSLLPSFPGLPLISK